MLDSCEGGIVFVQLIQGKTSDKEGLHRQLEAWMSKLRPDADGYLGTTGGVTDDGDVFIYGHVSSPRRRGAPTATGRSRAPGGQRPNGTSDGPVSFVDSADVDVQVEPSNDSGFVQVIQSTARDRSRIEEINATVGPAMTESSPRSSALFRSGPETRSATSPTSRRRKRPGPARGRSFTEAHRKLFEEWHR